MHIARHITIGVLITLYAFAYTPAVEFFKVPVLLAHYHEHKQENEAISLLDFIFLHYFSGHERSMDIDKHERLPFKNGECTMASLSVPAVPVSDRHLPETPATVSIALAFGEHTDDFSSSYLSYIWQPPRA